MISIKAGKFTLAITLIVCGVLMLLNMFYGRSLVDNLWIYSPAIMILFGLEILILNLVYMHRENYKVEVSVGSIVLIIIIIAFYMARINRVEIHDPFSNYLKRF